MKSKNIFNSFKHAFNGMFSVMKTERNMKIHLFIMILVIILGIIYNISLEEWKECVFCFGLVIGVEMINTAIEINTDLAMPNKHPKAKLAKDISAGAVLIVAITSAIIGLMIFIPKM